MSVSMTQFSKLPFQELWRQFLEEKEGPSEAAAAAPVQVFTLKKMSLLGEAYRTPDYFGDKFGDKFH